MAGESNRHHPPWLSGLNTILHNVEQRLLHLTPVKKYRCITSGLKGKKDPFCISFPLQDRTIAGHEIIQIAFDHDELGRTGEFQKSLDNGIDTMHLGDHGTHKLAIFDLIRSW